MLTQLGQTETAVEGFLGSLLITDDTISATTILYMISIYQAIS